MFDSLGMEPSFDQKLPDTNKNSGIQEQIRRFAKQQKSRLDYQYHNWLDCCKYSVAEVRSSSTLEFGHFDNTKDEQTILLFLIAQRVHFLMLEILC